MKEKPNETEAYRHRCECETLLSWPLAKRRAYLFGGAYGKDNYRGIEKARGRPALNRILRTLEEIVVERKRQKESGQGSLL